MFGRIFNAVYAPIKWSKAYDQAVAGSYNDAFGTLNQVYKRLNIGDDYQKSLYDFNLLFGWLFCKTGAYETALEVLTAAREQVGRENSLSHYDKDYLEAFCNWNIRYAAEMSRNADVFLDGKYNKNFDFSQLDKVKPRFRKAFPLEARSDELRWCCETT